ncbi:uncharacterized protein LOC122402138 [Colletes gigas]|uniref:uncharacterized protein LOC122402138 n=1 Tax=Colletes gigas TaxID=935657 RepID=UPI001C9A2DCD|nr:uncharacterized protein LOC122402138 [Colletes gigas]
MMDNLSDIYYLVQIIVYQIFDYLQDLILYKFLWLVSTNDEIDYSVSKVLASRNMTADVLAFFVLCAILFLIAMFTCFTSKCEKDEGRDNATAGIEIVSTEFQEEPYWSFSATSCFDACGDSVCGHGRALKRNFSDESLTRIRGVDRKRHKRILKLSIFGLSGVQAQNSQSTRTEMMARKSSQTWLVRRTRSGQIYGKYLA